MGLHTLRLRKPRDALVKESTFEFSFPNSNPSADSNFDFRRSSHFLPKTPYSNQNVDSELNDVFLRKISFHLDFPTSIFSFLLHFLILFDKKVLFAKFLETVCQFFGTTKSSLPKLNQFSSSSKNCALKYPSFATFPYFLGLDPGQF